tara:strand:- start:5568 stop:6389 length:822 start_codon:yes stop_codon:yes gene_type:complete
MKDAYYFSHDSNARNDQRLMKVRMNYGMQGYGIYFAIIEILREQANYTLSFDDLQSIAFDLRVEIDIIKDIVNNYYLFEIDENIFYSPSLKRRMKALDKRRKKLSDAGRKGGLSKAKKYTKQPSSIKVNNIKLNKKINITFEEFWIAYDYKKGDKEKISKKWESLKDRDRIDIMEHLKLYIKSTPDKQYRKHPLTYLNNKSWNDEIIDNNNGVVKSHKFKITDGKNYLAWCSKCLESDFYEAFNFDPNKVESKCCYDYIIDEEEKNKRKANVI